MKWVGAALFLLALALTWVTTWAVARGLLVLR